MQRQRGCVKMIVSWGGIAPAGQDDEDGVGG